MRTLMGWTIKLSVLGALYFGMTSGAKIKLPETILGYKVPDTAQQWVDRNAQIANYGTQTQQTFKHIGDVIK
ncbi:MAG TPA: hypothetical protein VMI56_23480 [Reyranella sp.]|nr:hypothetical protein [Reyranella sp.]